MGPWAFPVFSAVLLLGCSASYFDTHFVWHADGSRSVSVVLSRGLIGLERLTGAGRCVLCTATVAGIQFNPVIRAGDRPRAAGKAGKVRVVAGVRKLLAPLNATSRDGPTWDLRDVVKKSCR